MAVQTKVSPRRRSRRTALRSKKERMSRGYQLRQCHLLLSVQLTVLTSGTSQALHLALQGKKGERELAEEIKKIRRKLARIKRDPDYRLVGETEPYGVGL